MSRTERWTIIGVGVAVAGVLVAFLAWWFPRQAGGGANNASGAGSSVGAGITPPAQTAPAPPGYRVPSYNPTQTDSPPTAPPRDLPVPATTPSTAIDSVYVSVDSGNGLILRKGEVFELQPTTPSSINPPYMTFRWSSQGPGGQVGSSNCNVSADISGPGAYPQHRRSSDCTGRVSPDLQIMMPGTYVVSVMVTPPGGGSAVTGSTSFTVVPHGG
ncbi:hypothetical protein PJK45_18950 [Mycobacterium kansasii]|uniref:Uncharacterized protein n=3 Tax=Mycobacterium kansasii TaxID=1768 RepID=A0A653F6I4_MYCKA|nr:hypothetical protein [Mycobacterium kansasii]AGZ54259.1 hypothetical protein MKAN_15240 [Mycobacterium kansasii ATCC 12478]ARG56803.1 hypothetical protein B1T43_14060 [Mycobacterium kansasii]ARG62291.1 hypothetical protein B1T45_14405 [Mycobacterium kansasii]ARG69913.1 hypothetical protein B1T47_13625 [Mycobacterium kansasii]ARG75473.1 hypothetical protein B1T51_14455 [Mycobacterium kansasii]